MVDGVRGQLSNLVTKHVEEEHKLGQDCVPILFLQTVDLSVRDLR